MVENGPKLYVETFKKFKKKRINWFSTDDFGRNFFHHAALAGNLLGLQLAVKLMKYHQEMTCLVKISDNGSNIPPLIYLLNAKTIGGATPLIKATEGFSLECVVYLLSLGVDPLVTDNRGRNALVYA